MTRTISKIPGPGESGADVKVWQQALKDAGFGPGPIDGIWGRKTTSATARFQVFHKLQGSGIPGEKTTELLKLTVAGGKQSADSSTISSGQDKEEGTVPWYARMFKALAFDSGEEAAVERDAKLVLSFKERYEAVAEAIWSNKALWWIVGALHFKEASCNFKGCLANGEKIIGTDKKTTIVPKGLGPYETWEQSAIDILKLKSWHEYLTWQIGETLHRVERYNGLGYITGAGKSETSPYLWDRTNVNDGQGRYVADGKFDAEADGNKSSGFAAIVKWLEGAGEIILSAEDYEPQTPPALSRESIADSIIQIVQEDVTNKLRETGGKNRGRRIDEFNRRAKSYMGAPYCASGLWTAIDDTCKRMGLKNPAAPTASSQAFRKTSYVPAKYIRAEGSLGKKGDIAVLQNANETTHGHVAAVSEDQKKQPKFKTVEYNTDGSGTRDGDGAYAMTRSTKDLSKENAGKKFICFTDVAQWVLDHNS